MHADQLSSPAFVQSLMENGYALVRLPDEMRDQFDSTFKTAAHFFRAPLQAKMPHRQADDTGYRPLGVEFSSDQNSPDLMESFTVTSESSGASGSSEQGELRTEMLKTLRVTEQLAGRALRGLLGWYRQAQEVDANQAFHRWSILQLNYSRPAELQANRINDIHEDGCLFTVGAMPSPGLELRQADGLYIPITTAHNEVIIMAGEILELLSGGEIKPCFHRVRTVPYLLERMSLLMFADISPKACTPWLSSTLNDQIDIGKRVLTNSTRFGLQEWSE